MTSSGFMPSALAIMRETFPIEKLDEALGIWAGVIGASTAAGPIVGGLTFDQAGGCHSGSASGSGRRSRRADQPGPAAAGSSRTATLRMSS